MFDAQGSARHGVLPRDAQLKLIAAGKIGSPGSLARAKALDLAYAWIDCQYPEFVRLEKEAGK